MTFGESILINGKYKYGYTSGTYTYIQGSSLPANIAYPNNITVNYTYKPQTNLVASIENKHNTTTISKYSYTYNDRDQRIKVTLSDGSYWEYTYDEMGQLTSAIKYDSSGNAIPGHTFDYNFDTIGNRITSRKDAETQSYVSNELNQYTEIQDSKGTITPSYDADGNLLSDGRFTYTWNGENRLIRVETITGNAEPQLGIELSYDYQGRRIEKKVYENGVLTKHIKYIYDGWNVIAEIENDNLVKTYVWGEDLSGTLQGAGGVGGLLAVKTETDIYYPSYDGNGNITAYTDTSDTTVYTCEYTPFGKVLSFTGTSPCNFGFSTKYTDTETALIYYGYRYYSPELGRWLSRDPMGVEINLEIYSFMNNDSINNWDYLGRDKKTKIKTDADIVDVINNIKYSLEWRYQGSFTITTIVKNFGPGTHTLTIKATDDFEALFKVYVKPKKVTKDMFFPTPAKGESPTLGIPYEVYSPKYEPEAYFKIDKKGEWTQMKIPGGDNLWVTYYDMEAIKKAALGNLSPKLSKYYETGYYGIKHKPCKKIPKKLEIKILVSGETPKSAKQFYNVLVGKITLKFKYDSSKRSFWERFKW